MTSSADQEVSSAQPSNGRPGRTRVLLAARVVEQGAYGLVSLLLARWVGLDGYAPIGALLVFNSLAIVTSNFGVGIAILGGRLKAVGAVQVRRMRQVNALILATSVVAGLVVGGTWGSAIFWGGAIWFFSSEAFVRKSALLRLGHHRRVAGLEVAGSLAFLFIAATTVRFGDAALAISGGGLVTKHLIESAGPRHWTEVLGTTNRSRPGTVWWTQLLAYLIANVDFLIVSVFLSAESFAVYSLGFRAASLITSQISYAFGRVVMVEFAEASTADETQATYRLRAGQLLWAGVGGGVLMAAMAPLLPLFLGGDWRDAAWVVVLLAVATPWRMLIGVTGALMITSDRADRLVRWEVGRLVGTLVVLSLAALGNLWTFTAAVSIVAVVFTTGYNEAAPRVAGIRTWRIPVALAPPAIVAAIALALWIPV